MSQIAAIANKVVENATPVAGKNIGNTSSALMAGQLAPAPLERQLSLMESALVAEFPQDNFSASIARLALMRAVHPHLPEVFAASFGDDITKQELVSKEYASTATIASIQSSVNFARDIRPFAKQVEKFRAKRKQIESTLNGSVDVRVIPTASVESWVKAINIVKRIPKSVADAQTWAKSFFNEKYEVTADAAQGLSDLRALMCSVATNELVAAMREEYGAGPKDDAEKLVFSASGIMSDKPTWIQLVRRFRLTDTRAEMLITHNRAAELATSENETFDFSIENCEGLGSVVSPCASVSGYSLMDKLGLEQDESGLANEFTEAHLRALVYHIIAMAQSGVAYVQDPDQCNIITVQSEVLVSLKEHVLGPIYSQRLAKLWKAFEPEVMKLTFFTELVGYVKGKRAAQYIISNVRPSLQRALAADLEGIVNAVNALKIAGRDIGATDLLAKSKSKLVSYDSRLVTPFNDQNVLITTDNADFINGGLISATTIKPVGLLECPTANKTGFSEAILLRDKRFYDAVMKSALASDVATVYNRVIDLSKVSDYTISERVRTKDVINAALKDASRGFLRVANGAPGDVKASEYIKGATYTPINGDFYLQRVQRRQEVILIQAGLGHVKSEQTQIGNVHGSFAFGSISGQRPDFVTPFAKLVNSAIHTVTTEMFASYGFAPVTCHVGPSTDINLDQADEKYEERIVKLDEEFAEVKVTSTMLLNLAASVLVSDELKSKISADMVLDIRQSSLLVRKDMLRVLQMMAGNLINQLHTSHSGAVMKIMQKGLTTRLDVDDLQQLQQPVFLNAVQAATRSIADVVQGLDALTLMVFIKELLEAHIEEEDEFTLEG